MLTHSKDAFPVTCMYKQHTDGHGQIQEEQVLARTADAHKVCGFWCDNDQLKREGLKLRLGDMMQRGQVLVRCSTPFAGPQRFQGICSAGFPCFCTPSHVLLSLRMIIQQVSKDSGPNLL